MANTTNQKSMTEALKDKTNMVSKVAPIFTQADLHFKTLQHNCVDGENLDNNVKSHLYDSYNKPNFKISSDLSKIHFTKSQQTLYESLMDKILSNDKFKSSEFLMPESIQYDRSKCGTYIDLVMTELEEFGELSDSEKIDMHMTENPLKYDVFVRHKEPKLNAQEKLGAKIIDKFSLDSSLGCVGINDFMNSKPGQFIGSLNDELGLVDYEDKLHDRGVDMFRGVLRTDLIPMLDEVKKYNSKANDDEKIFDVDDLTEEIHGVVFRYLNKKLKSGAIQDSVTSTVNSLMDSKADLFSDRKIYEALEMDKNLIVDAVIDSFYEVNANLEKMNKLRQSYKIDKNPGNVLQLLDQYNRVIDIFDTLDIKENQSRYIPEQEEIEQEIVDAAFDYYGLHLNHEFKDLAKGGYNPNLYFQARNLDFSKYQKTIDAEFEDLTSDENEKITLGDLIKSTDSEELFSHLDQNMVNYNIFLQDDVYGKNDKLIERMDELLDVSAKSRAKFEYATDLGSSDEVLKELEDAASKDLGKLNSAVTAYADHTLEYKTVLEENVNDVNARINKLNNNMGHRIHACKCDKSFLLDAGVDIQERTYKLNPKETYDIIAA